MSKKERVVRDTNMGENVVTNIKLWPLLTVLLLGAIAPSLGGCNTTEGFGEDVERAGEEIQEEADEAR
jgi:predicted small secreted protein